MKTTYSFKRKSAFCFFLFIAVFLSDVCYSADSKGNFSVLGPGYDYCFTFTETIDTGKKTDNWTKWNKFRFYTLGYLTGVNEYLPNTYNIKGSRTLTLGTFEIMDSLESYCRKYPKHDFFEALKNIVDELKPYRAKDSTVKQF